ncbi:hypothetical protein [Streptomyces vietnamensis]|uniref:hypothetical protein n=1 Tax=Streptomyces vietnamensis TaxID=362257 RepID=UPI00341F6589
MTRLLRETTDGGEARDTTEEDVKGVEESTDEDAPSVTARDGKGPTDEGTPSVTATDGKGPAEAEAPTVTATEGKETAAKSGRRSATAWRRGALAAALTVLLLGGSGFFYAAHQLRSTRSASNHALTDAEATARVGGDVAEGLARVFSYTPAHTDAAERSARTVLAGRAARQYGELLAQVRANLDKQRITLSTQAVRTGVIELDGDSARLLVFLDQSSRRDKAAATSAAAQLTVTAKYQGDRWLIVDIKAR